MCTKHPLHPCLHLRRSHPQGFLPPALPENWPGPALRSCSQQKDERSPSVPSGALGQRAGAGESTEFAVELRNFPEVRAVMTPKTLSPCEVALSQGATKQASAPAASWEERP